MTRGWVKRFSEEFLHLFSKPLWQWFSGLKRWGRMRAAAGRFVQDGDLKPVIRSFSLPGCMRSTRVSASVMAVPGLVTDRSKRLQKRPFGLRPLVLAFTAQGLVLVLTLFVVVIGPAFDSEPDFTARKTVYLPQRELEHRMAVADFQQVPQSPLTLNKLPPSGLASHAVPPLPDLPRSELQALTLDLPLAGAHGLLGQSGLLNGLSGVAGETSSFSFFGLKEEATKVIICVDISTSVKNKVEGAGYTMLQVKEAAREVIGRLNANTLFGFIQFARNYDTFRPYLIAATQDNKAAADAWLEREFRTDGRAASSWRREEPNGIQSVVRAAFSLDPQPDVLIILSDGAFWRTTSGRSGERVPWDELSREIEEYQSVLTAPVRLHFIGFQMRTDDKAAINRLVRRYGGRLQEFE